MHNKVKKVLNKNERYRDKIFCRGFLFTNCNEIHEHVYPFYNLWKIKKFQHNSFEYILYTHPDTKFFYFTWGDRALLMVGHAYNPFNGEYNEIQILENLIRCITKKEFYAYFNQLTGVFTLIEMNECGIKILTDPTGMQITYYGSIQKNIFVSSHSQLIGYIANLDYDKYVLKLINYKFYPLFGTQLPGDLSPFKQIKRLVPNHYAFLNENEVIVKRFWPNYKIYANKENIDEIAKECANILKNSMNIIAKKWDKPAISMTGGCDSKTTLASAVDSYDDFRYFSYVSSDEEKADADAARQICSNLGLNHKIYKISENNDDYDNFELIKMILFLNSGAIGNNNDNDIRKRIFFSNIDDFDVEIKSWVSEIGRAYYGKRFVKSKFPQFPTSKYCRSLYKVFVSNMKLIRETDKIFDDYLNKYKISDYCYEWQDLFFWEFRMSAWNGLVITGEHKYSFDITIPYNNRILLEKMISVPAKYKMNDVIHKKIRIINNNQLEKFKNDLINIKHTKKRAKLERIYLEIFSRI